MLIEIIDDPRLEEIPKEKWATVTARLHPTPSSTYQLAAKSQYTKLRLSGSHLIPAVVIGGLATIPWLRQLRFRFSLRTLLFASTLVAVALGLIVWASR
jgi:hypothetical protein